MCPSFIYLQYVYVPEFIVSSERAVGKDWSGQRGRDHSFSFSRK